MHLFEPAQRQVRVDLGGGDVGVAEQQLHAAQVGAVLDHVRGATVAQTVRAGLSVGHFDDVPDPLAGQRHSAQGEKEAGRVLSRRGSLADWADASRTDAGQVGPSLAQINLQCLDGGAAERDDALLVALATHLHAAQVERQIAGGEGRDLGDAQSARIEQLQNRPVAQIGGPRLGMLGVHLRPLQHLRHLRLGEGLGKHLPGLGRLDFHSGVVMDAPVEQQPFVEAAQTAQLARRRTLVDAVGAQMLEKGRHILLHRRQQHAAAPLDELGKGLQVAVVGLTGERTQAFFHAQIGLVVLQKR